MFQKLELIEIGCIGKSFVLINTVFAYHRLILVDPHLPKAPSHLFLSYVKLTSSCVLTTLLLVSISFLLLFKCNSRLCSCVLHFEFQELHEVKRKNAALQMQQFVGEEKNELLDYLRSLQPEKVCLLV